MTLRGNHQRPIFLADRDRSLLNTIVARAIDNFDARLHAYCWMTNHLHLLLQVGVVPLSDPMRNIAAEFARAMQIKLQTTGHFFERRYHATLVDADAYLLELIRYIHLNPVRAGIVSYPSQYPWSSHHAYIGAREEPWVTTEFGLSMFALMSAIREPALYRCAVKHCRCFRSARVFSRKSGGFYGGVEWSDYTRRTKTIPSS